MSKRDNKPNFLKLESLLDKYFALGEKILNQHSTYEGPTLYHYTSLDNGFKILNSAEIWLRDFQELSDKNEIKYLSKLAKPIVDKYIKTAKSMPEKIFWQKMLAAYENQQWFKIYTLSCCFDPNNEKLWKEYANNHKGVVIGFKPLFFEPNKNEDLSDGVNRFVFSNIHYGEEPAKEILQNLFSLIHDMFYEDEIKAKLTNECEKMVESLLWFLCHHLIALAPTVKRKKYSDEQEHRLYIMESELKKLILPINSSRKHPENIGPVITKPIDSEEIDKLILGKENKTNIEQARKKLPSKFKDISIELL